MQGVAVAGGCGCRGLRLQEAPRNICCLFLFKMSKISYYGWLHGCVKRTARTTARESYESSA